MAQDGLSLEQAVRALDPAPGIVLLNDGSVALRFGAEGSHSPYAIIAVGGGGIRGPPGTVEHILVGVPDGGPFRRGAPAAPRATAVHASILPEEQANAFIAAQGGKRVEVHDEALAGLENLLKDGKHESAEKALAVKSTPAADRRLLEDALAHGKMDVAQRVADRAAEQSNSAQQVRGLRESVVRARARGVRAGADTEAFDQMSMKLSMQERSLLREETASKGRTTASVGPTVYAPETFSRGTDLPPSVYPRGKALPPGPTFVSRIDADSRSFSAPPAKLDLGELALERRVAGTGSPRSAAEVGSPYRLLGGRVWPITVVVPCKDGDTSAARNGLPPCHEDRE
jgi:hypothetical protein